MLWAKRLSKPALRPIFGPILGLLLGATGLGAQTPDPVQPPAFATALALGEALFFDTDLSRNRSQACASCHDPERAFTDGRETAAGLAASLGDDGHSLGDRNAPSLAYAGRTPEFHRDDKGFLGGQFWDGRARDLAAQAGGPPLNPIEMGQPDAAAVVARLAEKPTYTEAFARLFGRDLHDPAQAEASFAAMGQALAAFQQGPAFAWFDSRYDRWLRGTYQMTPEEELGRVLFFSNQFTNCHSCHQLRESPNATDETFTDYRFHNIGLPPNSALRKLNGLADPDLGLAQALHPGAAAAETAPEAGQFKTPSLRNVAVTGPYMHNGVFTDLRTVILFYNSYNSRRPERQINPETGARFAPPEQPQSVARDLLEQGPALDDRRIDALVAFLRSLTDARYEPLLAEQPAP